jgi:hypothetical protein
LKNPSQKRVGGVAQGAGPEFEPQYHIHTRKRKVGWVDIMNWVKDLCKEPGVQV